MNTRKNQNSILVLATLGVYLGLVLAGATPQVWGQSFNHSQRKTDSDNADKFFEKIESSFSALINGLASCKRLPQTYNLDGRFLTSDCGFSVDTNAAISKEPSRYNEYARLASAILSGFNSEILQTLSKENSQPYLGYDLNSLGLKLTVILSQDNADHAVALGDVLNQRIKSKTIRLNTYLQANLYENSKAFVNDNQIFVVTRLPRGSLDTLLASNAK